jgi:hypothetical protein
VFEILLQTNRFGLDVVVFMAPGRLVLRYQDLKKMKTI